MQKITIVLHALASFAIAIPTNIKREFIPGDGLPSLESLGLTTRDLYSSGPVDSAIVERSVLDRRFLDQCGYATPATVSDVQGCVNYLNILGDNDCTAPASGSSRTYCTIGTATITGSSILTASTYSKCSDVASGIQWVANNCKAYWPGETSHQAQGYAAANGNGNLIVTVSGTT